MTFPPSVTKAMLPLVTFIVARYGLPPMKTATARCTPSDDQEGKRMLNVDGVDLAQCLLVPSAFIRKMSACSTFAASFRGRTSAMRLLSEDQDGSDPYHPKLVSCVTPYPRVSILKMSNPPLRDELKRSRGPVATRSRLGASDSMGAAVLSADAEGASGASGESPPPQ